MPGQLVLPTLVPAWAVRSPTNEPSAITPLSHISSTESFRPTYHGVVEQHMDAIATAIEPLVQIIESESRRNINDYSLGSSLGYGQFGKVYKARSQNRVYAIKSIAKRPWNNQQYSMNQTMRQIKLWRSRGVAQNMTSDEAIMLMNVQKSRWEIYILSRLRSPYVVQLHECLDSPASRAIWIVNEWCSLGELQWKRQNQQEVALQWSQLVPACDVQTFVQKALQDLVSGLRYLQTQGCVHRDIKPSNILVDGRQKLLKLSDFGCSILIPEKLPFQDESLSECYRAELNKIVGTPAFIAPELCQFGNPGCYDVVDGFKLDVWSVGVTLYALLYNELPFYGESEFDTYHKVIHNSLEHRLNGDRINDMIVGRMLEKDAQLRIGTQKLVELVLHEDTETTTGLTESKGADKQPEKPTGVHKFFAKILKMKKKDRTPKSQLVGSPAARSPARSAARPAGSPSLFSTPKTQSSEPVPRGAPQGKPILSPGVSPVPQDDDDYGEPSLHSSLSSFEEPVQVSDMFKNESIPYQVSEEDDNMPNSSSGMGESGVSASESEPRRIDHCDLLQTSESHSYGLGLSHDSPSHSHRLSTIPKQDPESLETRSHSSYELNTPPEMPQDRHYDPPNSHQSSSITKQTSRDMDTSFSHPSFHISVPELPEGDFYDITFSREPSFQVSVPPEVSEQTAFQSRQQQQQQQQHSSAGHRAHNSTSTSSSSPIRIPTPMKALIHVGNSPVRGVAQHDTQEISPLKDQGVRGRGLAHSKDISNFQNYIVEPSEAPDPSSQDKHKSALTEDVIEKYLNYAENV